MLMRVCSTDEVRVAENSTAVVSLIFEEGSFQVEEISVPPEIADAFLVADIRVGKNSQLISSSCLPASFFARSRPPMAFDRVPRGCALTVVVTNVWKGEMLFSFSARGQAVRSDAPVSLDNSRRFLGLGNTLVPAHGEATIRVQPQVAFKPDALALSRNLEGFFEVADLRVVGESVFDVLKPVKDEDGKEAPMEWSFPPLPMQVDDWLVVVVKNLTGSERFFGGTIIGTLSR